MVYLAKMTHTPYCHNSTSLYFLSARATSSGVAFAMLRIMWTDQQCRKFYNSSAWKRKRIEILRRDSFMCVVCRKRLESGDDLPITQRRIRKAYTVHHIKELRDFPELRLDNDNLISVCHECHDEIHHRTHEHLKQWQFKPGEKKKQIAEELW